jgi:hypothetical protein
MKPLFRFAVLLVTVSCILLTSCGPAKPKGLPVGKWEGTITYKDGTQAPYSLEIFPDGTTLVENLDGLKTTRNYQCVDEGKGIYNIEGRNLFRISKQDPKQLEGTLENEFTGTKQCRLTKIK